MKKKLKKSLACLLAALLIFSAVPMSALADEAAAPATVTDEITAVEPEEAAAPGAEPDAERKPRQNRPRRRRRAQNPRPNRQQSLHRK